jgi:hypothetical protein
MTPCVVRSLDDDDLVGAGLARLRVDRPSEVERPAVGHRGGV